MLLSADRVLGASIVAWGTRKTAAWEGPIAAIQYLGQVYTAREEIILYKILFSNVQNIFLRPCPYHCNPIPGEELEFCWGSHTFVDHTSSLKVLSCLNIILQTAILNYQSTCQFIHNYLAIKF